MVNKNKNKTKQIKLKIVGNGRFAQLGVVDAHAP